MRRHRSSPPDALTAPENLRALTSLAEHPALAPLLLAREQIGAALGALPGKRAELDERLSQHRAADQAAFETAADASNFVWASWQPDIDAAGRQLAAEEAGLRRRLETLEQEITTMTDQLQEDLAPLLREGFLAPLRALRRARSEAQEAAQEVGRRQDHARRLIGWPLVSLGVGQWARINLEPLEAAIAKVEQQRVGQEARMSR